MFNTINKLMINPYIGLGISAGLLYRIYIIDKQLKDTNKLQKTRLYYIK